MNLNLRICVMASGLAWGVSGPAYAQQYFNCEYSPRCEAVQNEQCAPIRNLKDKIVLIRLHNSADDVEKTWSVLASFEPEYCGRLGPRGNIVREFVSFRAGSKAKLAGAPAAECVDPPACAALFVQAARQRWQRDDLEAKIKADLERTSPAVIKSVQRTPAEL